jgi:hypothetical protein
VTASARLAGFCVVLVVALGAGAALGATIGPDATSEHNGVTHTTAVTCNHGAVSGTATMEH